MKPRLHEDWIDPYAFQIVKNLQDGGFKAFLVGGCVRDLLAGIHPKDFDIATDANPSQVRKRVQRSHIIGRRFRLVLARRGDQQFEIATFRRQASPEELADENNTIEGDNFFGTVEEDAKRRDFTINALFYDPIHNEVIDHVQGLQDIEGRTLRMIGNPTQRLLEDPIRILRAIRLSHKLKFKIESELRSAISACAPELRKSVLPRRREEWLKFLRLSDPCLAFQEMYDLGVLKEVLQAVHLIYDNASKQEIFESYLRRFKACEINMADPAELFSAFLFAIAKAHLGEEFTADQVELDPGLQIFMKEEAGLFKLEVGLFARALQMMSSIQKKESYLRRGERRRAVFLANDALPLALKLSALDYRLSAADQLFWREELSRSAIL